MAALLFDTHKAVKDLQEAGFDEAQAEAVVATVGTAIVGNVATKQDVADALNATKQDVAEARNESKSDIQKLGSDLRSEMQAMELRITLRMGGLIVAGVALIIALGQAPLIPLLSFYCS